MCRIRIICMSAIHMSASSRHTIEWVLEYTWMRHVTHMNEACHTYKYVTAHYWMSLVINMNASCHPYEWGISHIWIRHGTILNESCYIYECVMSRTHTNASSRNLNTSHHADQVSRGTHIATHCNTLQHTATHCHALQHTATHYNTLHLALHRPSESRHTHEWVMAHIWMRHGTHTNESWHTHMNAF